jgi:serine/threonine protein kinase
MNESPPDLHPGDQLGKYTIIDHIGTGSYQVVFLAEQRFTRRKVALKVFYGDRAVAWARRQAELLATIDYPSIVRLYDADEAGPYFLLAVEILEGKSLEEYVSEVPLPPSTAIKLMLELVNAVSYVHERKLIVIDLKPANIILAANGKPTIVDFILTPLSDNGPCASDFPVQMLYFTAPEGLRQAYDRRSDLWALGMNLYFLLTNSLPHDWNEEAFHRAILSPAPIDLSALSGSPILPIVEHCLQKDPDLRYSSALELKHDLETALESYEAVESNGGPLALQPGRAIMLNVEYQEAGIPGQFREYRIFEKVGQGGFSSVYRAEDVIAGRMIALKLHSPEMANDPRNLARFRQEAGLLARLDDPNIIHVFNFGRYENNLFYVMEYLAGPTLRAVMDQQSKPAEVHQVVSIVAQILLGLSHIHAAGAIHRDIKPENIKLQPDRVVVMDLGLAHIESGEALTVSGDLLGTPRYMSPEQARGEKISLQTDLYAAGVILYEMLTGEIPHQGESMARLLFQIALEDPEPITTYRADLPRPLVRFSKRVLARDPASRPPSARAAYEELLTSAEMSEADIPKYYRRACAR